MAAKKRKKRKEGEKEHPFPAHCHSHISCRLGGAATQQKMVVVVERIILSLIPLLCFLRLFAAIPFRTR
jgi:hypothetical protein